MLSVGVSVRVGAGDEDGALGLGPALGLEQLFERRSGDRTRVDGFCDFEKVPPHQLCRGAKRD